MKTQRQKAQAMMSSCGYAAGGKVTKPSIKPRAIRSAPKTAIAVPPPALAGMKKGGKVVKMAAGGASKIIRGVANPDTSPAKKLSIPSAKSKMTRPRARGSV